MFQSRSGSQGNPSTPPQSIEAVRRRARHRLIGAAVLVLVGVVGFPLLFDTQPRPIAVDIPIVIPAKNQGTAPRAERPAEKASAADKPAEKALEKAAEQPSTTVAAAPPPAERGSLSARDSLGDREEVVEPSRPAARAETPAAKPQAKPEPAKPAHAQSEADRARALLEGRSAAQPAEAASQRIVVQVGAFADVARARETRQKLERAGLKTYTHVAETAEGQRIRVRLGPFATKAEADKAAARVKSLGLPAAILTL